MHLAARGHSILGDTVYGKAALGRDSQGLHAVALRFVHPRSGELVELETPLPDYFLEVLNRLGNAE